jgi:hypothetical protein
MDTVTDISCSRYALTRSIADRGTVVPYHQRGRARRHARMPSLYCPIGSCTGERQRSRACPRQTPRSPEVCSVLKRVTGVSESAVVTRNAERGVLLHDMGKLTLPAIIMLNQRPLAEGSGAFAKRLFPDRQRTSPLEFPPDPGCFGPSQSGLQQGIRPAGVDSLRHVPGNIGRPGGGVFYERQPRIPWSGKASRQHVGVWRSPRVEGPQPSQSFRQRQNIYE